MGAATEGRTIAALSSPPGPGDRAVIRLSGPEAFGIVRTALVSETAARWPAGRGLLRGFFGDGHGEQPVMVLVMPGPRSFTREDVVELHLPGAPPLAQRALSRVLELGAVPAGPGEFTRRAFQSGRIDLTRAEAVLEMVSAGSEAERRAAAELQSGGLATRVDAARELLEELAALCEASLDFDESDTGHVPAAELLERFTQAGARVAEALSWEERRAPARGLPRVVLCGAPNAGKSSLLNALAGAAHALVTPAAGTTRDGVEVELALAGSRCVLLDAPGLDPRASGVDRSAQERARELREAAHLFLWVVDAARPDVEVAADEVLDLPASVPILLVWTKGDRDDARPGPPRELVGHARASVGVSALTGAGLDELRRAVSRLLSEDAGERGSAARELAARHARALRDAALELERARVALGEEAPLDLVAEALRSATRELDRIRGETTPEDVLDRVFARFCIGK